MTDIGALVIGVGSANHFPPLAGARPGAEDFAQWARDQGCRVVTHIDDPGPVELAAVRRDLEQLCDDPISKLFLYFSGHGVSTDLALDAWVLSGSQRNSEAVDVSQTLDNLQAFSGIEHIVVFSDACRTIPSDMTGAQAIRGSAPIFRGAAAAPVQTETVLDRFFATKSGAVALERAVSAGEDIDETAVNEKLIGEHGFFTDLLIPALSGDVAEVIGEASNGESVVYARRLAAHLAKEVPRVTGRVSSISQESDARVESGAPLRVAVVGAAQSSRLRVTARITDGQEAPAAQISVTLRPHHDPTRGREVAAGNGVLDVVLPRAYYSLAAELPEHVPVLPPPNPIVYMSAPVETDISLRPVGVRETLRTPLMTETFAIDGDGNRVDAVTETGLYTVVTNDLLAGESASEMRLLDANAPIRPARIAADAAIEDGLGQLVRDHLDARTIRDRFETHIGLSIVGAETEMAWASGQPTDLLHEEGSTFVRAYEGGGAVVDLGDDRVAAVAVFPGFIGTVTVGPLGVRGLSYAPSANDDFFVAEEGEDLLLVRAMAESAVRSGRFDLMLNESHPFASRVRGFKHVDPVLGVLAAYAYDQVGEIEQIRDMVAWFLDYGQTVPFDLVMLADMEGQLQAEKFAPSWPLLAQGWRRFLRTPRAPELEDAGAALTPALWATVRGGAGRRLGEWIREGGAR